MEIISNTETLDSSGTSPLGCPHLTLIKEPESAWIVLATQLDTHELINWIFLDDLASLASTYTSTRVSISACLAPCVHLKIIN